MDTEAARAFLDKQYDEALAEFEKLAAANPNHALVLQYLAITLDRLGRYQEAIDVFSEALAIAPNNPVLHFHLGTTYYKARLEDEAAGSFGRVLELAPGSEYAGLARQYLNALAQQRAESQQAGAPQLFGAYIQLGFQHDDNVAAAPDGSAQGERSDGRGFAYLSVESYFLRGPEWQASVEVAGYGTRYDDEQFESFGVSQYQAGLSVQRTGALGRFPSIFSTGYHHTRVNLESGGRYSTSYSLRIGERLDLTRNTSSELHYILTVDDFAEEGFDPAFSSRDANHHTAGFTQTWYFNDRKGQIRAGVAYHDVDADGVNFTMRGPEVRLGATVPLFWDLRGDVDVSYADEDYRDFAGPVAKGTDRWEASATLSRWFGHYFLARLRYGYLEEDSTYESLTYDRRTWGLDFSYVY